MQEEEKITKIIEELLNHDIDKKEAISRIILSKILFNNNDRNIQALTSSIAAIYFNDNSDYLTAHYSVVKHLTGIEDLNDDIISKIFRELNSDCI